MKKITMTAASIALALGLVGCGEKPQEMQAEATTVTAPVATPGALGVDLQNIDNSVRAQDDFYYHVNGKWLEKTEIPGDKSNYGSFSQLYDESQKAMKTVLENASTNSSAKPGSDEYKIGAFYTRGC